MKLQSSRTFIESISLDSDRQYLTLHIPMDEYNIDEEKIFTYFDESKGSRYWFKSKDNTYNVIGINYIESLWRDSFSRSRQRTVRKHCLPNCSRRCSVMI